MPETIREFRTRNFSVIVEALPDDDTDLSWDDTGEVLAKFESGEYVAFCVRARVVHKHLGELAEDYLGGCIYANPAEFEDHRQCAAATRELRAKGSSAVCGSYFADMVRTVCTEARAALRAAQSVYVRN
jgi:hypothetical protein